MKIRHMLLISLFVSIAFLSAACEFSVSTANIKDAYMAREVNGQPEKTTVFSQDETFYCLVNLANAPDDTTMSASWFVVKAEGMDDNYLIDEADIIQGSGEITFDLSNDMLWPAGSYRVDITLNEELNQSLEFEVQ